MGPVLFLFRQGYCDWGNTYSELQVGSAESFYIREANKKVFLYTSNGDQTLYDFGVNVGDTVHTSSVNNRYFVVLDIDSVVIGNDLRKRIHVWSNQHGPGGAGNDNWHWIEGIGNSLWGILSLYDPDLGSGGLLCSVKQGGIEVFSRNTGSCSGLTGIKPGDAAQVKVFPNPAGDKIYIGTDDWVQVALLDLSGRLLENYDFGAREIPLHVPPGLYFLRLQDQDGKVQLHKIVKE